MICVAVLEKSEEKRNLIKKWFVEFTIQNDYELDILWIVDKNPLAKAEKYADQVQLALVSLDEPDGFQCGKALYRRNPDCRILYYREKLCDMEPLLRTRPISFYLWEKGKDRFLEKLELIYQEIEYSRSTFLYETRNRLFLLPTRNILYFQSDLRYVNIVLMEGKAQRIPGKLSRIEELTRGRFVRIHKSYLVNPIHVMWLDKKKHIAVLANGEELPISDSQYENACEKLWKRENKGKVMNENENSK